MKLIEEKNALSASGLLTWETATAARIIPEEISARFADAGNALVKATIQGKKGSRTLGFRIDNLSSAAMIARFQEMVDHARQVRWKEKSGSLYKVAGLGRMDANLGYI